MSKIYIKIILIITLFSFKTFVLNGKNLDNDTTFYKSDTIFLDSAKIDFYIMNMTCIINNQNLNENTLREALSMDLSIYYHISKFNVQNGEINQKFNTYILKNDTAIFIDSTVNDSSLYFLIRPIKTDTIINFNNCFIPQIFFVNLYNTLIEVKYFSKEQKIEINYDKPTQLKKFVYSLKDGFIEFELNKISYFDSIILRRI